MRISKLWYNNVKMEVEGIMSAQDLRINNTIFLMHLVSGAYARHYHLTRNEFSRFDDQNHVLRYVSRCPDVFDALPEDKMVQEIDNYVAHRA